MLDLGTLNINIKADGKHAKKEIEGVEKETEQTERTTEEATKKSEGHWKKLGKGIKVAAAGIAAAGAAAVAGLGKLASTAIENAADFGKLETAFTQAGFSAQAANSTFEGFVGLLGETDTAIEASNHLAQLCDSEEDLAKWTTISAGVFATFGDSLPLEGLTEAANETAKTGKVTGVLADALNWVGISEDEFNAKLAACADEQERSKLITDTLNQAYEESGEQYLKNNQAIVEYNKSMGVFKQTMTSLGTLLLPFISGLLAIANAFGKLANYTLTSNDSIQVMLANITNGMNGVIAEIPAKITAIGEAISSGIMRFGELFAGIFPLMMQAISTAIASIIEQLPIFLTSLITAITTMIPAILQGFITFWMSMIDALVTVIPLLMEQLPIMIQQIIAMIPTLIPMLLAAAIQLFQALVQAIPVIIPSLIQGAIDAINAVITMLPTLIPVLLSAAVQLFMALVHALPQILGALLSAAGQVIHSVITYIPTFIGNLLAAGKALFHALIDAVKQTAGNFVSAAGDLIHRGIEAVKTKVKQFVGIGKNIIDGLIEGIKAAPGRVWDALCGIVDGAISKVKSKLGIASPSKLFKSFGRYTMEGFSIGINDKAKDAIKSVADASNGIASAFVIPTPNVVGNFRNFQETKRNNNIKQSAVPANNIVNVNNYSPKALSEKETARQYRRSMRQLAMA